MKRKKKLVPLVCLMFLTSALAVALAFLITRHSNIKFSYNYAIQSVGPDKDTLSSVVNKIVIEDLYFGLDLKETKGLTIEKLGRLYNQDSSNGNTVHIGFAHVEKFKKDRYSFLHLRAKAAVYDILVVDNFDLTDEAYRVKKPTAGYTIYISIEIIQPNEEEIATLVVEAIKSCIPRIYDRKNHFRNKLRIFNEQPMLQASKKACPKDRPLEYTIIVSTYPHTDQDRVVKTYF